MPPNGNLEILYIYAMRFAFSFLIFFACSVFCQSFENLSLQGCIDVAKKNSLSLKSVKLDEKKAESSLSQAKNERLPGLSANAGQDVIDGYPFADPAQFSYLSRLSIGLSSAMPVYTGGRIGHAINRAGLRNEITKLNSEAFERNLSEQVIRAYMQVWSMMESEISAKGSLELSKKLLAKDSVLFEAGSFTAADLALAFAQVASDSLSLLQIQSNLVQNLTSLRQLLEIPQGSAFSLAAPDSAVSQTQENYATLLSEAEENSISKKIDSLSILAADETIGIAKAARWPNISLRGNAGSNIEWKKDLGYGEQLKNKFNYGASLSLTFSIIDWGATQHNILEAQVNKEQQQISALNSQKQLENTIETLALQTETYRLQWEVSTIQMAAQRLALDRSVQQHELGMMDISSLIQQQTIFNNTQVRHNQAKYSYLLGRSLLELQVGL
jgi:outer membrane protein